MKMTLRNRFSARGSSLLVALIACQAMAASANVVIDEQHLSIPENGTELPEIYLNDLESLHFENHIQHLQKRGLFDFVGGLISKIPVIGPLLKSPDPPPPQPQQAAARSVAAPPEGQGNANAEKHERRFQKKKSKLRRWERRLEKWESGLERREMQMRKREMQMREYEGGRMTQRYQEPSDEDQDQGY
jgi:hypothetical protein